MSTSGCRELWERIAKVCSAGRMNEFLCEPDISSSLQNMLSESPDSKQLCYIYMLVLFPTPPWRSSLHFRETSLFHTPSIEAYDAVPSHC